MINKLKERFQKYGDPCALKKKWEADQKVGSGFYYSITYQPILSFFQQQQELDDALELKIALIFSWNPKICKVLQDGYEKGKELQEKRGTNRTRSISIKDIHWRADGSQYL